VGHLEAELTALKQRVQPIEKVFGEKFAGLIAGENETIVDPEFKPVELPKIGMSNAL